MQKHFRFFKRKTDDFEQLLIAIKNLIVFLLTPTRIKRLSYDNEILIKQLAQSKVEIARTIRALDFVLERDQQVPSLLRNQLESLREFNKITGGK